jgi:hypothetical protein
MILILNKSEWFYFKNKPHCYSMFFGIKWTHVLMTRLKLYKLLYIFFINKVINQTSLWLNIQISVLPDLNELTIKIRTSHLQSFNKTRKKIFGQVNFIHFIIIDWIRNLKMSPFKWSRFFLINIIMS